jgi:hypothetical protein
MPDETKSSEPHTSRRSRRFVVRDADDHRVTEKIEEFLSGPRSRQRTGNRRVAEPSGGREVALDTRTDFAAAVRREAARTERYDRPATVLAVEFAFVEPEQVSFPNGALTGGRVHPAHADRQIDRLAGPIGYTLRREARDTDRIARVAPNRFHVLLPETSERDARGYIERARRACEVWFAAVSMPVELRIEAASTGRDRTLTDALAVVEERLSA